MSVRSASVVILVTCTGCVVSRWWPSRHETSSAASLRGFASSGKGADPRDMLVYENK